MTVDWPKIADSNEGLELEEGQVCRVLSVIDASSALIELRNGTTGRIAGGVDTNLSVGDVLFVSGQNVMHLPPESWPSGDRTGTIAWAGDDNVIVKSSGSTFVF